MACVSLCGVDLLSTPEQAQAAEISANFFPRDFRGVVLPSPLQEKYGPGSDLPPQNRECLFDFRD